MSLRSIGDFIIDFLNPWPEAFKAIKKKIPDSIEKSMNAIIDIVEMDCGGNWTLYVKLAFDAAPAALWLLITPSKEEIFESYLQPKAGRRGARRGRRDERKKGVSSGGKARIFFGGGIPDIDNQIADRIPGREAFAGRRVGPGEHLFWTGVQVADRVLWNYLLIAATEEFLVEWQSGLMESGQCVRGGPGYAKTITFETPAGNLNPAWAANSDLPLIIQKNMIVGNNGEIHMDPVTLIADGWAAVESDHTIYNDHATETDVFLVGFQLQQWGPDGIPFIVIERSSTVSCGPQQNSGAVTTGFAALPIGSGWRLLYRQAKVSGGGNSTITANIRIEIQAQSVGHV